MFINVITEISNLSDYCKQHQPWIWLIRVVQIKWSCHYFRVFGRGKGFNIIAIISLICILQTQEDVAREAVDTALFCQ